MKAITHICSFLLLILCNLLPADAEIKVLPPDAAYVRTMLHDTAGSKSTRVLGSNRRALVIGIGDYDKLQNLTNPLNDAKAIASRLQSIGFEVTMGIDLDFDSFEKAVANFTEALDSTDLAILFFAGHGMEIEGRNYILAQDAGVEGEKFLGAIPVDPLLTRLRRVNSGSMLILDACRDTGLAGSTLEGGEDSRNIGRGLTEVVLPDPESERGAGIYIAYSTAPNRIALDGNGLNSPFTTALIKHLTLPGVPISTVMSQVAYETAMATQSQQIPWTASSLNKEVFLNGQVGDREVHAVAEVQATESAKLLAMGRREEAIAEALKGLPATYQEAAAELTRDAYLALSRAYRSNPAILQVSDHERRWGYVDRQYRYVVTYDWTQRTSDSFQVYDFASGRMLKECFTGSPDVRFDELKTLSMNGEGTVATLSTKGLYGSETWVTTWQPGTFKQHRRWRTPDDSGGDLAVSANGQWVLTTTDKLRLWDAREGTLFREFEAPAPVDFKAPVLPERASLEEALKTMGMTKEYLNSLPESTRAEIIKGAESMRDVLRRERFSAKVNASVIQKLAKTPSLPAISPDTEYLVASFPDYAAEATLETFNPSETPYLIAVYKRTDETPAQTLHGHQGPIQNISFAERASIMASQSYDQSTRIWNLETGALLAVIAEDMQFGSVTLSPDGQYVSGKLRGGEQLLWNTSTGERIEPSTPAQVTVYDEIFNSEGRSIAPARPSHRAWAPGPEGNALLRAAFSELSDSRKEEVIQKRVRYWRVD
jgi:uncharacterized caspase-like protein